MAPPKVPVFLQNLFYLKYMGFLFLEIYITAILSNLSKYESTSSVMRNPTLKKFISVLVSISHAVILYSGEYYDLLNYSRPIDAEGFLGIIAASGK
jgi:hypothetical protein